MRFGLIVIAVIAIAGCATRYIKPTTVQNPPPVERFADFGRFELARVALDRTYAGQDANERATARIQEYFDSRVAPVVNKWNGAEPQSGSPRTLRLEPRIEHIKFIGGGARFWAGPLAGSSAVIMKVRYLDKASGKVVAEPEFFQRAAAWSGAFTVGGQDNAMLARIVTLVVDYTSRNYDAAVGGPSGATEDLVNATD